MSHRKKWSSDDIVLQKEVESSTKVDQDALVAHFLHGDPLPSATGSGVSGGLSGGRANESSSMFSIDHRKNDYMLNTAASVLGPEGLATALQNDPALLEKHGVDELVKLAGGPSNVPSAASQPDPNAPHVSTRQWKAIQKYPALVEFLGSKHGEKIASEIAEKVNKLMVFALGENAKKLSKHAYSCEAVGKNLKQFYVNKEDSWVCQVTANGPFRGDEAIYYNSEQDKPYVLRLHGKEYEDVSTIFNVVHEFAKGVDEQGNE